MFVTGGDGDGQTQEMVAQLLQEAIDTEMTDAAEHGHSQAAMSVLHLTLSISTTHLNWLFWPGDRVGRGGGMKLTNEGLRSTEVEMGGE